MRPDRFASLVTLGTVLLVLLGVFAASQREGKDQIQSFPAILVGSGLAMSCVLSRRRQRSRLYQALLDARKFDKP